MVCKYPAKEGKQIHLLNWDQIDRLYDLEDSNSVKINIISLCNQFIHSYVFVPELSESNRLKGFFIASDWQKDNSLYYIDVDVVINLFESVGNDYPYQSNYEYDIDKGNFQVSQS